MFKQSPWQTYTYADTLGWGDLLTEYNGQTITYDEIGNPINYRNGMTMSWQAGRQLERITQNGKTYNFTYAHDGLRTKKSITSGNTTIDVNYIYEGDKLIQMTYDDYVLTFSYDANGIPVSFHVKNATLDKDYYYGTNSRGDIEVIYNADGTLHARYDYDAYGKILGVTAPDGTNITAPYAIANLNPLRYRSYVYDSETGFYYLQSRYYDPVTCRFINADAYASTGQDFSGYNMFSYCGNNPIVRADDEGEFWHIVAGAVIGGVVSAVSTLLTGGSVKEALISGAFGMASGALTAAFPAAAVFIDAGFSVAESVTLNLVDMDENTTATDILIDASISAAFSVVPGDDYLSSTSFVNDVVNVKNMKNIMSNASKELTGSSVKKSVMEYKKKVAKEFLFAVGDGISTSSAAYMTSEATKSYVRLMQYEGIQ